MLSKLHTCLLQFAAELRVCARAGCPWKPAIKGGVQNLIQVSGGNEVELRSDIGWKLFQIFLITFREDDSLHSCPVGCQDLVFDSAHLWKTDQPSHSKQWTVGL